MTLVFLYILLWFIDNKNNGWYKICRLSSENLIASSTQESFTITQIVESLLDLKTVEKIKFLIAGEKANSLIDHIEIDKPFPLDK